MRPAKSGLKFVFAFVLSGWCIALQAQDDTIPSLLGDEPVVHEKAQNAFKTSRVINLQSMEVTDAGVLDMKFNHRFGEVNAGGYEAFGLDNAQVRIGGEYGVIPNLAFIFGRSSVEKMVDAGFKYRFMHQTTDNHKPLSMLIYAGAARTGGSSSAFSSPMDRFTWTGQLILGRKFSDGFSMQLSPTYVSVSSSRFNAGEDLIALGIAFRQKLTVRTTFNAEYIPVLYRTEGRSATSFRNSFSVGFDIETGGHVFQLHFTNSVGMADPHFIGRTTGDWMKGGFRFGFNISRVFTVVSPARFRNNTY